MPRMIGVESVDRSSSTKAMKNRMDKGVAGRSMMAKDRAGPARRCGSPETGLQDSSGVVVSADVVESVWCVVRGCGRGMRDGHAGETGRKRVSLREAKDGFRRAGDACSGIGTATECAVSSSRLRAGDTQLGCGLSRRAGSRSRWW